MMQRSRLYLASAAVAAFALSSTSSMADGDVPQFPKPKPKMSAPGPDSLQATRDRDDQIYSLGYWQAKGGAYADALATLQTAANQSDPRIQTMIGFSLRKLGRMDEAMSYYGAVLAAFPERTTTRQYLGEAYLQLGQPEKAKEQLSEIAKYCGSACEDFQSLADAIAKFEKTSG